ncbi:MAG: tetratricopeptide repeat protein, partial [Proteobacteria bacterium]|nr:tetratricopeptide repeat protein [Pseudomonadota bacterium]
MSDVFREVDEEVRKDRALSLWNRYGRFLIGGVVAVIVATAAWQVWSTWSLSQRRADAEQFLNGLGLVAQDRPGEALGIFEQLGADAGAGYRALAQLQHGAALVAAGDTAA